MTLKTIEQISDVEIDVVSASKSDKIIKKLEDHFGYNKKFTQWLNTYSKELGEIPFLLSLTEEGIKKLEKYLEEHNDQGLK